MLLALWLACTINETGPATPGSPSADLAAQAGDIAKEAAELEALAFALEQDIDEGRRRVESGASTEADEIARTRAQMAVIEEKNAALQARVKTWEQAIPHPGGGEIQR